MKLDTVITWLIHSDWFMLATWIVLLGGALAVISRPAQPAQSKRPDTPPAP